MPDLGRVVREARGARGWSQGALAAAAGLNERTVARLENGHKVSRASVDAILRRLGIEAVDDVDAVREAEARPERGRVPPPLPEACDRDHAKRRDLLVGIALARHPGATPVVSDVRAFDAAHQAKAPTRHFGSASADRIRKVVVDRRVADWITLAVVSATTMAALARLNGWAMSQAAPVAAAPVVGGANVLTVFALLLLLTSAAGDGPVRIVWPFLRRFHRSVDWTRCSARLRDVAYVVQGPVLTRYAIEEGDVRATAFRLDAWAVDVAPEGEGHVTVTLRADGRCDEVLWFIPTGPASDGLLAGAAYERPLAA